MIMNSLLIGTKNKGKLNEFKQLFKDHQLTITSLLDHPNQIDVEETGTTFSENAILKAETICNRFNIAVIADDSGLEIEALQGRPGIYSARYAGLEKSDEANIQKVLQEMRHVPWEKRQATFVCVLALAIPGQKTVTFEGRCKGIITEEPKGENGFGYDPIFYIQEKGKTMAELPSTEKNKISHRTKALQKLLNKWNDLLN